MIKQFEYCTKFVSPLKLDIELEAFGEQGWELVQVIRGGFCDYLIILKREKC